MLKGGRIKAGVFTLVELLMVVSIIMVLAALVFPALSKVKEKAIVIKCMSNQRQIYVAFMSYAGDNRGLLNLKTGAWWVDSWSPVNKSNAGWGQIIGPVSGHMPPKTLKLLACPGTERYPESTAMKPNETGFNTSYESRGHGAIDYIPPWGLGLFNLEKLISNKRFLISCAFSHGNSPTINRWMHYPGGYNVLYAQGNVKWYPDPTHEVYFQSAPSPYANKYYYAHGKFEGKSYY